MRRYTRTLGRLWSASLFAEMEYRTNFVVAALNGIGTLAGTIFTLSLFYRDGFLIGGWVWTQALFIIGCFTFLDGFQAAFLGPNFQRFSEYIREGTLDFVLLKPIDSQFFVSFRNLSLWGIPNLVLGPLLILYAGFRNDPPVPLVDYLVGALALGLGTVMLYAMGFFLVTFTIWFVKLWNITIALQSIIQAGRYPISSYPPAYRFVLTYLVPVLFLTTVPAEAFSGRSETVWILGAAGLATGLLLACRLFYLFALRSYTSASS
ncbi:MAG: ABC-2 family transporter protein [Planctomycetota bacterium]|jgi:ABC-2 type transport system permease protein|nr:ABC-2 family transporter protein [Planctomycetota bacterium]